MHQKQEAGNFYDSNTFFLYRIQKKVKITSKVCLKIACYDLRIALTATDVGIFFLFLRYINEFQYIFSLEKAHLSSTTSDAFLTQNQHCTSKNEIERQHFLYKTFLCLNMRFSKNILNSLSTFVLSFFFSPIFTKCRKKKVFHRNILV